LERIYKPVGILEQEVDGELLVVSPDNKTVHCLSESEAQVYRFLSSGLSQNEMAERLMVKEGWGLDIATCFVAETLALFQERELVICEKDLSSKLSRRTLLQAASLMPAVLTTLTAAPAAAASSGCNCSNTVLIVGISGGAFLTVGTSCLLGSVACYREVTARIGGVVSFSAHLCLCTLGSACGVVGSLPSIIVGSDTFDLELSAGDECDTCP